MPAQVGKGTGRAIAKGHVFVPNDNNSTRRASSRRTNRRSGRK